MPPRRLRRCRARPACRCSRSTSRRESTARPARSHGAGDARAGDDLLRGLQARVAVRARAGRTRAVCPSSTSASRSTRRWMPRWSVLEVARPRVAGAAAESHKWSSGCLVVGGSSGMVGAPLLAGSGRVAYRRGNGRVRGARNCRGRAGVGTRARRARRCPRRRAAPSTKTRPRRCSKELAALPRARDRSRASAANPGRRPRFGGSSPRPTRRS